MRTRGINRFVGLTSIAAVVGTLIGCGQERLWLRVLPAAVLNRQHDIEITRDLPFVERDGQPILLDLYRPADAAEPLPLVIIVHGGFWVSGSRQEVADFAYDLAAQGYAVAAIDYRLVDGQTTFPDPVADVLAAVRYFRDHADDHGIDPQRIALLGKSAGGHLALLAGMTDDASIFDPTWPAGESAGVAAVVNVSGPTDFTVNPDDFAPWQVALVEFFLGQPIGSDPAFDAAASPVSYARADGPPVMTIHCTCDQIVPVSQARSLRAALDAAGQPNEYLEIPDRGHVACDTWLSLAVQSYRNDLFAFLAANL